MLGAGGMGEVWRAEQAEPIHRTVALKLIKAGMDTRAVVARFDSERQALALMEHPNIAKVFEAGATPEGRPYFVMEYVHGFPITDYCDRHRLTIEERLGLFMQVCEGVQHAHQKAIIHRDLKPSNVLVEEVDDKPVPKIIDFGLAKAMGQQLTEMTLFTEAGAMLGTPDYMSPEQADRNNPNIDTRTDVYSLGVILYELLVGELPIGSHELRAAGIEAMLQKICEQEPLRPSTKLKSLGPSAKDSADRRKEEPESLERHLRGDLDWITMKALEKDRARRYGTPSELAADIHRYVRHEPVLARPASVSYRLGKYARRHTAGVTAAVLVVLSLTVGLAFALREAKIASMQRARAEQRFNDVRALANSLMFNIYDSIRDLPGSTQARQLVVTNALKYLDSLAKESRGDRSLQSELADAYERVGSVQGEPYTASLGDTAGALQSFLKAQAIRRALVTRGTGKDQIKYAYNLRLVAALQMQSSNAVAAVSSAEQAVSIAKPVVEKDPKNWEALTELGADYEALGFLLDEALIAASDRKTSPEENYSKALKIDEELVANSKDPQSLRNLAVDEYHIGRSLRDTGYRAQAVTTFENALPVFERLADNPNKTQAQWDLATIVNNLGDTFQMNGDAAHALANYRRSLGIVTALSAADPNNGQAKTAIGEGHLNVGSALVKLKDPAAARESLARAIGIFEKAAAAAPQQEEYSSDLGLAYVWFASVALESKTSLEDYQKALAIEQKIAQVDKGNADWLESEAQVRVKLGDFYRRNRQLDNASESYSRSAAIAAPIVASRPERQEARYALASAYCGLGDVALQRAQLSQASGSSQTANWKDAQSWYQRSWDAWQQIRNPAAVTPNGFDVRDPEEAKRGLARANAALAGLTSH